MEGVMSTFNNHPDFVSVERAAEMLSVSTKTIRNWIKSGDLPAFEAGPKLLRISVLDIRAFCKPVSRANWKPRVTSRTDLTAKTRENYGHAKMREVLGRGPFDFGS
jgi:excisionase family DNA binding protein